MTDFFMTRMGHTFFEATVPGILRTLQQINSNAERIATALEQRNVIERQKLSKTTKETKGED